MRFWATVSKILGGIWLALGGFLIFAGIFEVWSKEGFPGVQDLLSPFNICSWIIRLIIVAPGIGLLMLSEMLQDKSHRISKLGEP